MRGIHKRNGFFSHRAPRRLAVIGASSGTTRQAFSRLGPRLPSFRGEITCRPGRREETGFCRKYSARGIGPSEHRAAQSHPTGAASAVTYERNGRIETSRSRDTVGAGRPPNLEGLDLDGPARDDLQKGVRWTNTPDLQSPHLCRRRCLSFPFKFTHMADATARIALRNALFRGRSKLSSLTIPGSPTPTRIAQSGIAR